MRDMISVLAGVCLTVVTAFSPVQAEEIHEDGQTVPFKVYMIRHAERDPGANPPLNERGRARAKLLAGLMADSQVTAIYVADFRRNRQTARPLAERAGIPVHVLPKKLNSDGRACADYFMGNIVKKHSDGNILFIGNSKSGGKGMGNLQEIYRRMGGDTLPLTRYFDMYVFYIHPGRPAIIRHVMYGDRSEQ